MNVCTTDANVPLHKRFVPQAQCRGILYHLYLLIVVESSGTNLNFVLEYSGTNFVLDLYWSPPVQISDLNFVLESSGTNVGTVTMSNKNANDYGFDGNATATDRNLLRFASLTRIVVPGYH